MVETTIRKIMANYRPIFGFHCSIIFTVVIATAAAVAERKSEQHRTDIPAVVCGVIVVVVRSGTGHNPVSSYPAEYMVTAERRIVLFVARNLFGISSGLSAKRVGFAWRGAEGCIVHRFPEHPYRVWGGRALAINALIGGQFIEGYIFLSRVVQYST